MPHGSSSLLVQPARTRNLDLLTLPNEVLTEISTYLDCADLLSMRMCCKVLCSITRTIRVWHEVTRRLCEDNNLALPERGVQSHDAEESGNWCLRCGLAQDIWKDQRKAHPQTRITYLNYDLTLLWRNTSAYVLPGGRWMLLSFSPSNIVFSIDLESPSSRVQVLLDEPALRLIERHIYFSFWNDPSSAQMFYRMAITVTSEHNLHPTWVYNLEFDDDKPSGLICTPYMKFRKPMSALIHGIRPALNKEFLVQVCMNRGYLEDYETIHVYPYDHGLRQDPCHSMGIEPVIVQLPSRTRSIWVGFVKFVHDNVFIAYDRTSHELCVFDIVRHDPGDAKQSYSVDLLHQIPLMYHHGSGMQWTPGISRMVAVSSQGDFQGLQIPHDRKIPPSTADLGRHESFSARCHDSIIGISTSVHVNGFDKSIDIARHDFSGNAVARACVRRWDKFVSVTDLRCTVEEGWGEFACFSEDIGRLVFLKGPEHRSITIVDLVPRPSIKHTQ